MKVKRYQLSLLPSVGWEIIGNK